LIQFLFPIFMGMVRVRHLIDRRLRYRGIWAKRIKYLLRFPCSIEANYHPFMITFHIGSKPRKLVSPFLPAPFSYHRSVNTWLV
jgi:hypothetical protein